MSSTQRPDPSATQSSGSSATKTGMPVEEAILRSSPGSSAPPPVRTMPCSMTSPDSSGGHSSRVVRTAEMIASTGSSRAARMSRASSRSVWGMPPTFSRPRTVKVALSSSGRSGTGHAEPMAILTSSAVRSPMSRECSLRTHSVIAASIRSPATRSDCEVTMPPSEMTATSEVPPPMSTTIEPRGSETGSPAPIAAAIGSSIRCTVLAPARVEAWMMARRSTWVTPDGTQTTIRVRTRRPGTALRTKCRIISSAAS